MRLARQRSSIFYDLVRDPASRHPRVRGMASGSRHGGRPSPSPQGRRIHLPGVLHPAGRPPPRRARPGHTAAAATPRAHDQHGYRISHAWRPVGGRLCDRHAHGVRPNRRFWESIGEPRLAEAGSPVRSLSERTRGIRTPDLTISRDEKSDENLSQSTPPHRFRGEMTSPRAFSYYSEDEPCPEWGSAGGGP
jgi:hypothetical protein